MVRCSHFHIAHFFFMAMNNKTAAAAKKNALQMQSTHETMLLGVQKLESKT